MRRMMVTKLSLVIKQSVRKKRWNECQTELKLGSVVIVLYYLLLIMLIMIWLQLKRTFLLLD